MTQKEFPLLTELQFQRAQKEAIPRAALKVLTALDTYMALNNIFSIPITLERGTRYCERMDDINYCILHDTLKAALDIWSIGKANEDAGIHTRLVSVEKQVLYVDTGDLVESLYTHSPSLVYLQRALNSAYDARIKHSFNLLQQWQIRSN